MHAHFYPPEGNDCRTEGILAKMRSEINTADERRSARLVAQSRRRFPDRRSPRGSTRRPRQSGPSYAAENLLRRRVFASAKQLLSTAGLVFSRLLAFAVDH